MTCPDHRLYAMTPEHSLRAQLAVAENRIRQLSEQLATERHRADGIQFQLQQQLDQKQRELDDQAAYIQRLERIMADHLGTPGGTLRPQVEAESALQAQQRCAATSLDDAETLYRALFESMDEGICLLEQRPLRPDGRRDYRCVAMNSAMQVMFGIADLRGQLVCNHFPAAAADWSNDYDRVLETGVPMRFECESPPWGTVFEVFLTRVEDSAGYRLLAVIQDVTARKRSERNLAFLADLATDLSRLSTADEIMATVGAKVGAYLNVTHGLFATIDEETDQTTVNYTWHTADRPNVAGVYRLSDFITEDFRQAARAGETIIINDAYHDPHIDRDRYATLQIRAYVSVPCHREGTWKYLLTVNDAVPRTWREEEIALIQEVTNLTFPRLERAEAEAAAKNLTNRLTLALQAGSYGVGEWDFVNPPVWNEQMYKIYGLQDLGRSATYYQDWLNLIHPDDISQVEAQLSQVQKSRDAITAEFRIWRPDGELRWVQAFVQAERDGEGKPLRMVSITQDITVQKNTEAALQAQTNRVTLALQAGALGTWEWDLVNPPVWDERMYEIYGMQDLGRPVTYEDWLALVVPEDAAWLGAELDSMRQGSATFSNLEIQFLRPDGQLGWVQIFSRMLRDEDGQPVCMIGINQDITVRKQAELALKEQSSRLTLALKAGSYGIWEWNLGSDLMWDDQIYQDYGLQDLGRPITYQDWRGAVHPDDLNWVEAQLEADLRASIPFNAEFRIRRPDGEVRWVMSTAKLYCDGQGHPLRMVGLHQDITHRKQAEQDIRESRAKFQRLVDDIGDRFVIFSHTGRVLTYVSGGLQSIFGVPPEAVLGKDWATAVNWFPETLALAQAEVQKLLTDRASSQEFEMSFTRPDGEVRTVHVVQHPVWDEASNLLAVEGLLEDITERKATEATLRRTNAELERATRLKDEFLANMSHELRTPLNAILGLTEGLQEEVFGPLNERQQRSLDTVQGSGQHLLSLINDILDLAKIDAGQMDLNFNAIDVSLLCTASIAFVKQQAHKKQQQITTLIPDGLPNPYGDDRRLRQVLINLLTNAVKFTPGGGQITLAASYTALDLHDAAQAGALIHPQANLGDTLGVLSLTVTDTGIGIGPEDSKKLFQPFVQVNAALNRQHEGTGLGLSLVKRIVEAHGGEVTLTSNLDSGSCFTVQIPIIAIPADDAPAAMAPESTTAPPAPDQVNAPVILLAEDNEANICTTSSYLAAKGYRLILARNGLEAVNLATTAQPDLILMDIQMPLLDGLAAIRQIRQNPALATVPIIALTALAMPIDEERCRAAGANHYLSKPIRLRQLAEIITTLLAASG